MDLYRSCIEKNDDLRFKPIQNVNGIYLTLKQISQLI